MQFNIDNLTETELAIIYIDVLCCHLVSKDNVRAALRILGLKNELGEFLTLQKTVDVMSGLVRKGLLNSNYAIEKENYGILMRELIAWRPKKDWIKIIDLLQTKTGFMLIETLKLRLAVHLCDESLFFEVLTPVQSDRRQKLLTQLYIKLILDYKEYTKEQFRQLPFSMKINLISAYLGEYYAVEGVVGKVSEEIDILIEEYESSKNGIVLNLIVSYALHTFCIDVKGVAKRLNLLEVDGLTNFQKAALHFLNDENEKALSLFKEEGEKEPIEGVYLCLSLFRKNTQETLLELGKLLQSGQFHYPENYYLAEAFNLLNHLRLYLTDPTYRLTKFFPYVFVVTPKSSVVSRVLSLICTYITNGKEIAKTIVYHDRVFQACEKRLPGIARAYCQILLQFSPENQTYLNYLEKTKHCYSINFAEFIPIEDPWKASLDSIEQLLIPSKESQVFDPSSAKLQLLWIVNAMNPEKIIVLEQKRTAKGGWSKGRPVALKHFYNREDNFDYLLPQDLKVIDTIRQFEVMSYRYHKSVEYEFRPREALLALIGHPNVVEADDPGSPIHLVKGDVELHIKEQESTYRISIYPYHSEKGITLEKVDPITYQIIDYTEEHCKIARSIGETQGINVPKSEKNRILKLLQQSVPSLVIQGDVERDDLKRVEGDASVVVCLSSVDGELHVSLYMQPFGSEGPMVKPGEGRQNFVATIKGESLVAVRTFEKEEAEAAKLIDSIEELTTYNEGNYSWVFGDPVNALNVLTALEEFPTPINKFWMKGKEWKVTKPVTAKRLSLNIKGSKDWFELEGKIEVDDGKVCELKDLLTLLDNVSGRYVKISDGQFLALTHEFKKQLMELKALAERGSKGGFGINMFGALALGEFTEEVGSFKGNKDWKELADRFRNAKRTEPVLPKTLQAELREYQLEGYKWMSRLTDLGFGVCLADDMGLGKTIQGLAVILEHASKGPSLIIVPTSVSYNWINEIHKFAPTLNPLNFALDRNPDKIKNLGPHDVLVVSYGLLLQDEELLSQINWQCIIIDEAQYIKNAQAKRSKAAMKLKGNYKLALTGTPLENHLGELWSIFQFINPGLLGTWESFQQRFLGPIERTNDPATRQALKKLIHPFILRRLKSEVLEELPPKTEQTMFIERSPEEVAFYEALRQKALETLTKDTTHKGQRRIQILAELTKLRRAACHSTLAQPEIDIPSSKLKAFMELVMELRENKHRALVFSQFIGHLDKIKEALDEAKIDYQYLDGSTPVAERQARVNAFQGGQSDLFLISLKAGGTGLNLTAADYVIHMDPWWNPAVEDQASDRAHRIGQERPVTIYRLLMADTIEEKIYQLHNEKRTLADDLLSGTDGSGKMSEEDLLRLLTM